MNRQFSEENIKIDNNEMRKCLTSLLIRELQVKIIKRYHYISLRIATIKIATPPNAGKDVEKLDYSHLVKYKCKM
jgi:hypothetical protein